MDNSLLFSPFPTEQLLEWYGREKRSLPWRGSLNPYTIWISEVILQQTRVDQGTPYYYRFLEAFPTVTDLANASEDQVLKLWEGLGYYSRARNLHATAKIVAFEHGGQFPNTYAGLLTLKGIGPYTAAAIGSIAFGVQRACVDGNVTRVLTRYYGISEPIDSSVIIKLVDGLAQKALKAEHPGEHNQAMMELGATVCLPKLTKCEMCPLMESCSAFAQGLVSSIPMKVKRTKIRNRYFNYVVLSDGTNTWLKRREAGDIWQGLYEFPLIELDRPLETNEVVSQFDVKGEFKIQGEYGPYKHLLSHQRIFARFIEVWVSEIKLKDGVKISWDNLDTFALPRLLHRYLNDKKFADSKKV
jgi:A/G-specific adenine glycosylase